MKIKGTVRNIVDFGAFVDIGLKNDALIHIGQIADRYIRHPKEVFNVGDVIETRVTAIDRERSRVSLSLKNSNA
jgi:uncharacterized protein